MHRTATAQMPTVSFNDIGGLDDVKEQMKQMIEYPVKYRKMFRDLNLSVRQLLVRVVGATVHWLCAPGPTRRVAVRPTWLRQDTDGKGNCQ